MTAVVPVVKDGITIGYTITFSKSQPITIYHGEDGKDGQDGTNGKDGYTPQIGVKQDSDNIYYWTLDGEWLLDAKGNKIQANGIDGTNGTNGQDGKNGITPQLKIENDYWYISYDNGSTWTQLGKATGEDGKDGIGGGDSIFKSVTQDDNCVYFELADSTIITINKSAGVASNLDITFDLTNLQDVKVNSEVKVNYEITGNTECVDMEVMPSNDLHAHFVAEDDSNKRGYILIRTGSTFDELTTFLHEFGHACHGMLAKGKHGSLNGTNVFRDFVELPSQILENWAYEKEYLDLWAKHYKTGETMPTELIDKLVAAKNYLAAYANVRQVSFGMTDMAWHTLTAPYEGDVVEFEQKAMAAAQILPVVEGTALSPTFGHLFSGGYAAGYYGYKWAEVLAADGYSLFAENGIFDKSTATKFRKLLESGGKEHPMDLYVAFRGHKPQTKALIDQMGLNK